MLELAARDDEARAGLRAGAQRLQPGRPTGRVNRLELVAIGVERPELRKVTDVKPPELVAVEFERLKARQRCGGLEVTQAVFVYRRGRK